MHVLWVELRDFRNHRDTKLDLPDGLITAVGPNGEGKTNLLEGIAFLLALTSPRVSTDEPLVRRGAESAFVRGEVQTRDGKVLIEIEVRTAGANRVQVNRSPIRRKRDLRRRVQTVFFGPDDLAIVQGDPGQRRRFMDEALVALRPQLDSALRGYERVVRQRNRLLKDHGGQRGVPEGLDTWDLELVEKGVVVIGARAEAVALLAPHAGREFRELAGYDLEVSYLPSVAPGEDPEETAELFGARLAERRSEEIARRTTLAGPHRDDLSLGVRQMGARGFASHGEAWGAALSLRLGLASALHAETGESPVTVLDDPFSALDPVRRAQVAAGLTDRGQVVVSVADETHIPDGSIGVWDVNAGKVSTRAGG